LDIGQTIKDVLTGAPPFIQGVISYHFGWVDQNFEPADFEKGKFLRPTLCLLVFEALTGSYQDALPVAAAIEMIHNFTLIHDDVEDNDLQRHGRPTAWAIWGKPLAINIGDYLYTLAFHCLHQLDLTKFPPERVLSVLRLVSESCLVLTTGQDLDLRFEQVQDVSTEMYLDMVYRKTGALLEAAVLSGAILGAGDSEILENYRAFARNIGIAFQVRDDILGIWGDSAMTGKSRDNDLRRKKKTLPVIYTLNEISGPSKKTLKLFYNAPGPLSDEQIQVVRACLEQARAYQYTQKLADHYIHKAFTALNKISISNQAQSELEAIARFLVDRTR
jgi:geranylgeranyl diphosphate synthase type I